MNEGLFVFLLKAISFFSFLPSSLELLFSLRLFSLLPCHSPPFFPILCVRDVRGTRENVCHIHKYSTKNTIRADE